MPNYIVFDAEYRIDTEAHARYIAAERKRPEDCRDPNDPLVRQRWPFRRPVAISWLVMEADANGVPTPVALKTVGAPEDDEPAMLRAFFAAIADASKHSFATVIPAVLIGWASSTTDLPQLLAAAARNGVTVPDVLEPYVDSSRLRDRRDQDLMLIYSMGGARVHLAEVAAAMNVPAKPVAAPEAVAGFIAAGKWSSVKATAEADVLTTACLLGLRLGLQAPGWGRAIADRVASYAARLEHRPYAADFAAYRDRLRAEATDAAWRDQERRAA